MGDIGRETVIKVKFEEEDMLHINKMFLKIQLRKSIFSKSSKIFFGVFAGIIILSMLILMLAGNSGVPSEVSNVSADDSSMIDKIVPGVIFVSVALILMFILPRKIRQETINNFRSNKDLQNEIEYRISEEKVIARSITSDTNHDWSYFNRAVETNKVFALYLSDNTAICLPKRCFTNENDIDIVRKIMKDNLQGQKYQYLKIK